MSNEKKSVRENKLLQLKEEHDVDPYPSTCLKSIPVNVIRNAGETDSKIIASGRLTGKREHGKTVFADLRDGSGTIQLYFGRKVLSERDWSVLELLDLGDFIQVEGSVFTTRMGELTVKCERLELLSKSLRQLPVVKVDSEGVAHDEVTDPDFLFRHRCVDLHVNPDSLERFRKRSRITSALRSYLDSNGFLEVETPVLQPLYGGAAAEPFETKYGSLNQQFYLRIATELYLKRLIAGGLDRVYELGKDFRNEGVDRTHSPEFTQLELYEAYADYSDMMNRFEEILCASADSIDKSDSITYQGTVIDLTPPFRRIGFMDSLREASGEDLFSWEEGDLRKLLGERKIITQAVDRITMLDKLFDHYVACRIQQPTFVIDYPEELSPLAKRKKDVPGVTERFEVFVAGLELANAFSEQNNPILQRRILTEQAEASIHRRGTVDEEFLYALETGIPPTGGMGIGVDRLVMILTDTAKIRDTILFPHLRRNE